MAQIQGCDPSSVAAVEHASRSDVVDRPPKLRRAAVFNGVPVESQVLDILSCKPNVEGIEMSVIEFPSDGEFMEGRGEAEILPLVARAVASQVEAGLLLWQRITHFQDGAVEEGEKAPVAD